MNSKKVISKMNSLGIPTKTNCSFSQLTTIGTGGTIQLTVFPQSSKQMATAIRYFARNKIPFYLLGKGSNVLASDDHFDGVVVSTKFVTGVAYDGCFVTAECGTSTAKVAQLCVAKGLGGGEFLACLPASVGGVTVCNAGCFGQCAKDIVHSVKVLHNGVVKTFTNKDCQFSHRNSIFKGGGYVVLQVVFCFQKSNPMAVAHNVQWMKMQKSKSQPLGAKTAGCVLYHPSVALSPLIDKSGLKGYQIGQAKVSKKHAGFVINIDKSTSKDIYLLIQYIRQVLLANYNVTSQVEVNLVNFAEDTNDLFSIHQAGNSQNHS